MFIAPNSKSSIPPLEINSNIITDERDKSNVLNNFFQSQTLLNDQDAILPDLPPSTVQTHLQNIVLTPSEVELVLETLSIGKASGPNGLIIVSFEHCHTSFLIHFVPCLISHYKQALFQLPIKKQMVARSPKKEIYLWCLIIIQYHC